MCLPDNDEPLSVCVPVRVRVMSATRLLSESFWTNKMMPDSQTKYHHIAVTILPNLKCFMLVLITANIDERDEIMGRNIVE